MSWWPHQRLGGVLLIYFLSIRCVYSLNQTSHEGIPEIRANASADNKLVYLLLRDCKVPTLSCIQKTLFHYIENAIDHTDNYEINGFLKINKNNESFSDNSSKISDSVGRSTQAENLINKVLKFIVTHSFQIHVPEIIRSAIEITPKGLDRSGLITKLEYLPKVIKKELGSPRIFFKKIKKFIGEKLLNALLAIVLVIALLLVKFLFFLPLIMGVAAAKKVLLKLLLFFFPFLSHLFKLCPYVNDGQQGLTKFHHHHHQIAHLHHVPPHLSHHGQPAEYHSSNEPHQEYDAGLEYYGGGPDVSADFLHRKTDPPRTVLGDQSQIHSWASNRGKKPQMNRPLTPAEIEALSLKAEREAVLKVRLQQEHNRVQAENKFLHEQIQHSLKVQDKLKQQVLQLHNKHYQQATDPNTSAVGASKIMSALPFAEALYRSKPNISAIVPKSLTNYDTFYSPILEKIDKVLSNIGFTEEPCRERIICSMYKNPTKFSPHSNLISVQLSRESDELQKPTSTNTAVVRFYKYVQAARDGQDKRDCLRLYPTCAVNTEL